VINPSRSYSLAAGFSGSTLRLSAGRPRCRASAMSAIAEGVALVTRALSRARSARTSCRPPSLPSTTRHQPPKPPTGLRSWPSTTLLERVAPNPMATLNRAVALAMVQGPAAELAVLDTLSTDDRIAASHHLLSVRAHLLEMAGDHDAARAGYREAARRTTSEPERRHLLTRAARLG
jgi:predicted RNA polymerase sigma factor